jgi:hypothetical protein
VFLFVLLAQTSPDLTPSPSGLPGATALSHVVQGIASVALLGCGAG